MDHRDERNRSNYFVQDHFNNSDADFGESRYWVPRKPDIRLWSEKRIAKFKALFETGISFSKIAAELGDGLTRNSCIGKAHRLGLRRDQPKPNGRPAIIPRHELKAPAAIAAIKANPGKSNRSIARENGLSETTVRLARHRLNDPPVERSDDGRMKYKRRNAPRAPDIPDAIVGAIGLFDLQPHSCRWPVGKATGHEQLFCGHEKLAPHSYCAGHVCKAFNGYGPRLRVAA